MALLPISPVAPAFAVAGNAPATLAAPLEAAIQDIVDTEGRLAARCSFLQGQPHGAMTAFNINGQPSMEAHYQLGQTHGPQRLYDEQGQLLQQTQRVAGLQDGLTKTYFPTGKLMLEQRHSAGVLNGESVSYAESGDITAKIPYLLGKRQGGAVYFHEGRVIRQENYKAGLLDGDAKDYTPSGSVALLTPYRANVVHGTLKRFWPNGNPMEEVIYRNGKPTGSTRNFDVSGKETAATTAQPGFMKSLEKMMKGT